MDEPFSLSISEGAAANILSRAREGPTTWRRPAAGSEKVVFRESAVRSDEPRSRVNGKTLANRGHLFYS